MRSTGKISDGRRPKSRNRSLRGSAADPELKTLYAVAAVNEAKKCNRTGPRNECSRLRMTSTSSEIPGDPGRRVSACLAFHFRPLSTQRTTPLMSWRSSLVVIVTSALLIANEIGAEIDYAMDCDQGYRVSAIRRTRTYYNVLGSLTIECEQIARPDATTCAKQPSIPRCNGQPEGCVGDTWLGGFHAYLLENSTQAIVLDPVCCTSPSVRIDSRGCINDLINTATDDFAHSVVSDLAYRGLQCWHQYSTNRTLVDLLWKMEICPFQSSDFPVVTAEPTCEECRCRCGVQQCANGAEPVRVIHRTRTGSCGCDCRCTYRCVNLAHH